MQRLYQNIYVKHKSFQFFKKICCRLRMNVTHQLLALFRQEWPLITADMRGCLPVLNKYFQNCLMIVNNWTHTVQFMRFMPVPIYWSCLIDALIISFSVRQMLHHLPSLSPAQKGHMFSVWSAFSGFFEWNTSINLIWKTFTSLKPAAKQWKMYVRRYHFYFFFYIFVA